ncbi:MAG: glycosyltransferase family 1 protein [Desulfobacteraceae bacterium]|nr:MAG: glycosyltransferase family 1 protein [Desulfobacteraceae bacterium]
MKGQTVRVLCITDNSDRPEAETFIGLKKKGVDIAVMCPSSAPHYTRLQQAGVPVLDVKLKSKFSPKAIRMIRGILMDRQIQILHLFNNNAISNGLFASRNLPVKIIAYRGIVSNISFLNPASWMTHLNPRVDHIICVAEKVREYFLNLRFLRLRVPPEKPVTIHKGHSLEWYQNAPADLSQFGIPQGAFTVCCTANYRPRKGIHVFIQAAGYLPKDADIHFLLVGEMKSARIMRLIQKSPMKEKIHLTGYRKDAPEIAAACNVAVLPALRREGLPKVIIEAMAYGVAPIVTNSGGSPELIEDGKSGIIVPPGSAEAIAEQITRLYKNPLLCREIGANAKKRIADSFRIEDTIERTYALYEKVLGRT